jgi:two-component system response regulator RegA
VKRILILEDEVSVMEVFRPALQEYSIIEATTAQQAVFECRRQPIDLLIADVTLPVESGILVALELLSLSPASRVILISGYPLSMWNHEDTAKLKDLPLGAVNTLQKPFSPETLRAKVHGLIGTPTSLLVARP